MSTIDSIGRTYPEAIETAEWLNQQPYFNRWNGIDRRRVIKACRVLRNDLRSFDNEYVQQFGRRPVGVERGDMQKVHDTYRLWKTRIRGKIIRCSYSC